MRRWLWLFTVGLAGCTPGAIAANGGSGSAQTTIDINLTLHAPTTTPAGTSGGYAPAITTVAAGSTIRFVNSDGFAHTATAIGGTAFPASSPITGSAQSPRGSALSQMWSSGTLQSGASSQTFVADLPGTYLFGCFFHYGSPMRAEIVVQ